jgi:hypothetical protein
MFLTTILYAFLISPKYATCPNNVCQSVQIINVLIVQYYPTLCHFLPLRSKFSHHPVFKHPQYIFILSCERPSFTPTQNYRYSYSFFCVCVCVCVCVCSAFPGWGNGLLKGHRVRRFSATTKPFANSESAVARWFPDVNFRACTHL